ncbi:hypothetical protein, partial [Agrobacterium vitis]|uniref:hypothetical protein n=1 Tax=Agrobacterium vitis TaxID=373 RepID=UPI001AEEED8C
ITPSRRAERRRRALLEGNVAVLLDELGHFIIMTKMSDNARLSFIFSNRQDVQFCANLLA